jgi:hypothetical protein
VRGPLVGGLAFELLHILRCGQAVDLFENLVRRGLFQNLGGGHHRAEAEPLLGFDHHLVAGVEHVGPAVEIVYLAGRFESNANDLDHIRRG